MKKVASIFVLILCLIIGINLIHSIYSLWKKQDLIVGAKLELEKEKKEQESLQKKLSVVKKEDFIEEEARNKLFLAKPNETEILIPQDDLNKKSPLKKSEIPNWQKWLTLFFGS